MSRCTGVECDRCGARSLLDAGGLLPTGWGSVRLDRVAPYACSGVIDLCPTCWEPVYDLARTRLPIKQ